MLNKEIFPTPRRKGKTFGLKILVNHRNEVNCRTEKPRESSAFLGENSALTANNGRRFSIRQVVTQWFARLAVPGWSDGQRINPDRIAAQTKRHELWQMS